MIIVPQEHMIIISRMYAKYNVIPCTYEVYFMCGAALFLRTLMEIEAF